eukprot:TRINITY_DN1999_c1_g1_i1.p1 TRINITY_DN1999_c1_g1~~TRINITY_DN1999_c1_g1_i1.p1  ORF type:complete len:319 (+),score=125.72 TRINITY_DN1999_c1_g1_i1:100-1056(+)
MQPLGAEVGAAGAPPAAADDQGRWQMHHKLGEGTYGVVYKGTDTLTGTTVAIKKIRLGHEEEGMPSTALREISILKEVYHPNVVNLIEVNSRSQKLELIFEFCDCDMKQHMSQTKKPFAGQELKSLAFQLCCGAAFCHQNRIIHRDLKPQNLLLVTQGGRKILKIADFGLARTFQVPLPQYTHEIVTLWYRAPEVLLGEKKYSHTVDSWSVGTIIPEMASRQPLFPGDCEIDELFQIFRLLGTPTPETCPGVNELPDWKDQFPRWPKKPLREQVKGIDPTGLDLIEKLLHYDPPQRLSCVGAARHPWFDEVRGHPSMP